MADTNAFTFHAQIADRDVRAAIREELDAYRGSGVNTDHQTDTTLDFEAYDVEQGMVQDAFAHMLRVIRDGVDEFRCPICKGRGKIPNDATKDCLRCQGEGIYYLPIPDFGFSISDEPQDGYLGQLRIHVPGLPDFSGDCDANGAVVVRGGNLLPLICEATSLEILRADIAVLIGRAHIEYFKTAEAGPPFATVSEAQAYAALHDAESEPETGGSDG